MEKKKKKTNLLFVDAKGISPKIAIRQRRAERILWMLLKKGRSSLLKKATLNLFSLLKMDHW